MARRRPLIAALLVAVLLAHGLALEWLSRQARAQAALRLMAAPMFTRLLQPEAPPPPVPQAPAPPPRKPRAEGAIQAVTPSTPQQATATAAIEPAPPPEPEPTPAEAIPPLASEPFPALPESAGSEPPAATETAAPPFQSLPDTATSTTAAGVPESPAVPASSPAVPTSPSTSTATATATAPAVPGLDSWPADTRLNYRVGGHFRGEIHGNARVQWQREGERYQTRIDIDLGIVSLVMTSQGEVTAQGLAPGAYEETRAGKRRTTTLQPDRILLSDGRAVPRPPGVQDTASQFVELSHRFASGQLPLEVGRSVTFWMARPGGVDEWTYDVAAREVLQTPRLGAVEAFHLKPRPLANPRGNVTAEMWFAPSLQYLPVRIRVTTGDAHLDLFVESIEQR